MVSSEIGRLSHHLIIAVLEDLGLRIALVRLAEDFQNSGERQVRVEVENVPDDNPVATSTALYPLRKRLGPISMHDRAPPHWSSASSHFFSGAEHAASRSMFPLMDGISEASLDGHCRRPRNHVAHSGSAGGQLEAVVDVVATVADALAALDASM